MDKYISVNNRYDKTYMVFTDGAVSDNRKKSKKSKGGIGIYYHGDNIESIGEPFYLYPITNQRSELYAIIVAIQNLYRKIDTKKKINIIINTDSQYSINCMTKWVSGWKSKNWKKADGKPVLNMDLIFNLDKLLNQYSNIKITFNHVRSHQVEPPKTNKDTYILWYGNEQADKLANQGKINFL